VTLKNTSKDSLDRNEHFWLVLVAAHPNETFQIDLLWHTHILFSAALYDTDCLRIRGTLFHHDESMSDHTPGMELDKAYQQTRLAWKKKYASDYSIGGVIVESRRKRSIRPPGKRKTTPM
jgi:hypothetical protein